MGNLKLNRIRLIHLQEDQMKSAIGGENNDDDLPVSCRKKSCSEEDPEDDLP